MAGSQLKTKAGFDWRRVVWSRPDSPQPSLCCYCSGALAEAPLMLWNEGGACIAFCDDCVERYMEVE